MSIRPGELQPDRDNRTQGNRATSPRVWTAEAVRALGLTTDVATAGEILGIGRTMAYALARNGDFPVTIIKIGHRYIVPTHALLAALDVK